MHMKLFSVVTDYLVYGEGVIAQRALAFHVEVAGYNLVGMRKLSLALLGLSSLY